MVCVGLAVKRRVYQRKVDVDILNAVKSVLADVWSVSPSSEQRLSNIQLGLFSIEIISILDCLLLALFIVFFFNFSS